MDKYNPMEESGADFLARTAPDNFQPQTVRIKPRNEINNLNDFQNRKAAQKQSYLANTPLGSPRISQLPSLEEYIEKYKLASKRPLNPDPPEEGSLDYLVEQQKETSPSAPPSDKYGYFEYGDKRHENTGGGWNVLQPGQAAQDANIERQYQEKLRNKKPGNVTGKPLLPSKLFM